MASTLDLDKGCTVEELLRGCIEAFGELPAARGDTPSLKQTLARTYPGSHPAVHLTKSLFFAEKCPNRPLIHTAGNWGAGEVPTLIREGHYLSPWGIRRNSLSLAWELFPADGGWFIW